MSIAPEWSDVAWDLFHSGVTYGDIASTALQLDMSFEDAMLHIWLVKGKD